MVRDRSGAYHWFNWLKITSIYGILAWALSSVLMLFTLGFALLFAAPAAAAAMTIGQRSLLARFLPLHNWSRWIAYSLMGAAVATLTGVVIWFAPQLLGWLPGSSYFEWFGVTVLVLVIGAIIFAIAQWLVVRTATDRAHLWICADMIGIIGGGLIGAVSSRYIYENYVPWHGSYLFGPGEALMLFLAGAIGTLLFSPIQALAWLHLLDKARTVPAEPMC